MKNFAPQHTLLSLQKRRQDALLHNQVRQATLSCQERTYAATGKAKKFYALMAQLKNEEEAIKDDLEQYVVMLAN